MADGLESVVLEVDPRSVHNAIVQANKDVESWEKGIVGAGDRMQKSLERMADLLIKVNDKQRSSLERLTQAVEKQAAAYGKTGVGRLVAERDRLIKKLGDEEGMINRVRGAYEQMIAVEKAGSSGGGIGGTGLNARYLFFGAKDLMEGRTKFAIAEAANEMMRLQGTALAVGGAVAGVTALGFAAYEVVKGLREIREEPEKIGAEFAKLEEPLRTQNDELRSTNAHLEETIAKLKNQPADTLKTALYDARVEADKLAESLTKDLDKLTELLKKNEVSTWHKILGEAGTSDVANVVQQLSKSQDMLMALFSEAMAKTKNPEDVKRLQADFSRRLKNLYEGAEQDLRQRQGQEPGVAWFGTILSSIGAGVPNIVYQDTAARQRTLKETLSSLDELLGMAQERITGSNLKPEKDRLEGLRDQAKKAQEERKKFETEAASFVKRGDESELDAIGKIYYERDQLLKQAEKLKGVEAEIAAIRKSADEQAGKVLKDSWEKFEEYDQKRRLDQQKKFLELFLPTKEQLKEWEDVFKAQERIQDIDVQAQKEALRRHGNAQVKQAATPEDAYQIRVDLAVKLAQIEVDRIRREDDNAKRMVMAAEAQKQLYTDLAAAQDELEEKRAQAAERAAEEAQREFDTIQKEASGLFHTLLTRPQEFGKQLGNTLREAILKPVTDAFGGMIATAVQPLVGGIGGMFKGMFGTKDPVKVSTDLNTAATAQNSAAVAMLTAVLAGFMGIGMPMFAAPSIPGISGITLPSFSAPAPATRWAGLPKFADGGVTTGPTIVGEAGPELVIPLKRLQNMGLPPSVNLVGHYGPETTEALGKATGALMSIALPAGLAALGGPAGISVGDTLMALLTGGVAAATPPRNDGVMLGVIPIGPPGAGGYAALSDEAKLARIASIAKKVQVTTRPGEWIDIPGDTIWIGPRQRFAMPGANNEVWGEGLIREVYDPSVPASKQRITTLGIPENQRGQGVGQALYLAALKHGPINWEEPFQSLKITEEASQVRAALVRKGLAERRGDWMVLTEKARRLLGMDDALSASVRGPRDLEYMAKPKGPRGVRDPQSDWYYKEGGRDDWGMTHDMHVSSGRKGGIKSGITRQIQMANRDPELDPSGMYIGPPVDVPETTHDASMKLDALLGDRFRNIVWKEVKGVAPGQGQKVRYGDEMLSLIEAGKRIGKDASGISSWLKRRFPGQPFNTIDLKRALDERGWTGGKLPSYDSGGSVASTGLAVVHKGEAVIPQADTLKHSIDNLTGAMNGNTTMFRWLLSSMFGGRTMAYPVAIPGVGTIQIPMGGGGGSTTFSISGGGGYTPVSGGSTTALAPEGGYTPAPWAWSKTGLPNSELQRIDQMVGGQGGKFLSKGVFSQKALKDALSNLKGSVWNEDAWNAYPWTTGGVLAGGAQAIATSPAAGMAGVSLALAGLTGDRRGTWGGAMESAAGGALIGDQVGGPLGAAAGASFGFEVAMFEKLFGVESPQNEAKRLVKQIYSINIDNSMARDIVNVAQQKYAGHVSIAVRDPDVRKMLMLYSQATGQKFPLSASTPQSAALAESGGRLYQQATYVNGMPYTFQSNLPVLGGYQTGTYPMPGGAPLSLQVNVSGQGAAQFVAGQVVTPEFVQAQWSSAGASSNGRLQNSAMIQQPGLLVS
jgi:hypothetical protein